MNKHSNHNGVCVLVNYTWFVRLSLSLIEQLIHVVRKNELMTLAVKYTIVTSQIIDSVRNLDIYMR